MTSRDDAHTDVDEVMGHLPRGTRDMIGAIGDDSQL